MTTEHDNNNVPMPAGRTRYDGIAMTLHWLIALAVIVNVALGLYMGDLPRGDVMKPVVIGLHMSLGLSVLVLAVVRVVWRFTHSIPSLPGDMPPWQKALARTVEGLLYVIIILIPLAGWAMISTGSHGHAVNYFGLFNWPAIGFMANVTADNAHAVHEALENTHVLLAWTMVGLAAVHVAAALYHQHIRRDNVLKSMLPFG